MAGLRWERDGLDWPHRQASRFVEAAGLRWHVQQFPVPGAPLALLLHGTGAAAGESLLARAQRIHSDRHQTRAIR